MTDKWYFPKKPRPWYGPDDYLVGDDISKEEEESEKAISIWVEAFNKLTPWQRFLFLSGIEIKVPFRVEINGPYNSWGIYYD